VRCFKDEVTIDCILDSIHLSMALRVRTAARTAVHLRTDSHK